MRLATAAVFCLLSASTLYAQEVLPGQDLLGSDRALHRGDTGSLMVSSPDANTQIAGYAGDTSGVVMVPGVQTTGTDSRTNLQNVSIAGEGTQTGALAARRGVAVELGGQARGAGGDNGSVWNANTLRKSNIVGAISGGSEQPRTNPAKP